MLYEYLTPSGRAGLLTAARLVLANPRWISDTLFRILL